MIRANVEHYKVTEIWIGLSQEREREAQQCLVPVKAFQGKLLHPLSQREGQTAGTELLT